MVFSRQHLNMKKKCVDDIRRVDVPRYAFLPMQCLLDCINSLDVYFYYQIYCNFEDTEKILIQKLNSQVSQF